MNRVHYLGDDVNEINDISSDKSASTRSWNNAVIFEHFHARVYDEFSSCCYDLGGMSEAVAYFLR